MLSGSIAEAPRVQGEAFAGPAGDDLRWWAEYVRDAHARLERGEIARELDRLIAPNVTRPPRRILDVGAGPATFLCALHARYPHAELRGIDASEAHVALAREDLARRGVPAKLELASGEAIPAPAGTYDLVVCQAVMPYARDDRAFLAELRRVLRPGGALWFATHGAGFYLERLGIPGIKARARNAASLASGLVSMATGHKLLRDSPVTARWLARALARSGFDVRAIETSSPRLPKLIRAAAIAAA